MQRVLENGASGKMGAARADQVPKVLCQGDPEQQSPALVRYFEAY